MKNSKVCNCYVRLEMMMSLLMQIRITSYVQTAWAGQGRGLRICLKRLIGILKQNLNLNYQDTAEKG